MLAFLLTLIVGCVAALVLRWRDIPARPLSDKFLSRDNFFVLAMLTIGIIAGVIAIGTSMPLISMIPGLGHWLQGVMGTMFELDDGTMFGGDPLTDGRFNVATTFYNTTTPPLGIVAVALMTIGPLLGWRDTNVRNLLLALRWPGGAAVLATCVALLLGVRDALPLAYVSLSTFALGVNLLMIMRTLKSGWLRIGGYLAHVGLSILLIGVVGSSVYASPDERLAFEQGDTVTFQDYAITFNSWEATDDGGGGLDLTVQRGNEVFSAQPELYFDSQMGSTIQNPFVKSYIWQDLYIAPADYRPEFDPSLPVISLSDEHEMGPYHLTFEDFEIDTASMMSGEASEVGARMVVAYEGEEMTVTPAMHLGVDDATQEAVLESLPPVELPGGDTLALVAMMPESGTVMLSAEGPNVDSLPVEPETAVITVSTKPAVLLVWVGMIIGITGGAVAMFRRYLEGKAQLSGARVRLPGRLPNLGGLPGRLGLRGGRAARR
jgi:cytochrome c-type biogenesis protein CcmF